MIGGTVCRFVVSESVVCGFVMFGAVNPIDSYLDRVSWRLCAAGGRHVFPVRRPFVRLPPHPSDIKVVQPLEPVYSGLYDDVVLRRVFDVLRLQSGSVDMEDTALSAREAKRRATLRALGAIIKATRPTPRFRPRRKRDLPREWHAPSIVEHFLEPEVRPVLQGLWDVVGGEVVDFSQSVGDAAGAVANVGRDVVHRVRANFGCEDIFSERSVADLKRRLSVAKDSVIAAPAGLAQQVERMYAEHPAVKQFAEAIEPFAALLALVHLLSEVESWTGVVAAIALYARGFSTADRKLFGPVLDKIVEILQAIWAWCSSQVGVNEFQADVEPGPIPNPAIAARVHRGGPVPVAPFQDVEPGLIAAVGLRIEERGEARRFAKFFGWVKKNWALVMKSDALALFRKFLAYFLSLFVSTKDGKPWVAKIGKVEFLTLDLQSRNFEDLLDCFIDTAAFVTDRIALAWERMDPRAFFWKSDDLNDAAEAIANITAHAPLVRTKNWNGSMYGSIVGYSSAIASTDAKLAMMHGAEANPVNKAWIMERRRQLKVIQVSIWESNKGKVLRKAPFSILFYGGSSVAKSSLAVQAAKCAAHAQGAPSKSENVFNFDPASKFMSGIDDRSTVVIMDDIANAKLVAGVTGANHTTPIISMINNIPYYSIQAEADLKGKIQVAPVVVVGTTNVEDLNVRLFSNEPLSIMRRFKLHVKATVAPGYGLDTNPSFCDPAKAIADFPDNVDVWNITVRQVVAVPGPVGGAAGYALVNMRYDFGRGAGLEDCIDIPYHKFEIMVARLAAEHNEQQEILVERMQRVADADPCVHSLTFCEACRPNAPRRGQNIPLAPNRNVVLMPPSPEPSEDDDSEEEKSESEEEEAKFDEEEALAVRRRARPQQFNFGWQMGRNAQNDPQLQMDPEPVGAPTIPLEGAAAGHHIGGVMGLSNDVGCLAGFASDYLALVSWGPFSLPMVVDNVGGTKAVVDTLLLLGASTIAVYGLCWIGVLLFVLATAWWTSVAAFRVSCKLAVVDRVCKRLTRASPFLICGISFAAMIGMMWSAKKVFNAFQSDGSEPTISYDVKPGKFDHPYVPPVVVTNMSATTTIDSAVNILSRHTHRVVVRAGGKLGAANIVCVKDDLWVGNAHVFPPGLEADVRGFKSTDFKADGDSFVGPGTNPFRVPVQGRYYHPGTDLVFFRRVDNGNMGRRAYDLMPKRLIDLGSSPAYGKSVHRNAVGGIDVYPVSMKLADKGKPYTVGEVLYDGVIGVRMTNTVTFNGQCGSPLIIAESGAVFAGIHFAGNGPSGGVAHLCRDLIDLVFERLRNDVVFEPNSRNELLIDSYHVPVDLRPVHAKSSTLCTPPDGNLEVHGKLGEPKGSGRSGFEVLPFGDSLTRILGPEFAVKHGPPPRMNDRRHIDRHVHTVSQACTHEFDVETLDLAARDYQYEFGRILDTYPEEARDIRPIPIRAALNGIPGQPYIKRIDGSTSQGYPFGGKKVGGPNSKITLGDDGEMIPSDELLEEISRLETIYARGDANAHLFECSLKDEAVKLTKDKVRTVNGGSVAFLVLCRKYTLSMMAFMMRHWIDFETAVGIAVTSKDWHEATEHMHSFGIDRVIAGDYKDYDMNSSLVALRRVYGVLMWAFRRVASMSALFTSRDLTIINGIFTDICEPTYRNFADVFSVPGTNPSGHPWTTVANSILNSIYLRYVFYNVKPRSDPRRFKQCVALLTYGDDNKMSVSHDCGFYNHTLIQAVLATAGIEYTMADKTSESVPLINGTNASFLKCTPRWSSTMQRWTAPVEEASISKMLNCRIKRKGSPTAYAQMSSNVGDAMRKYFEFGREIYEQRRSQLLEVAREHRLAVVDLGSYDEMVAEWKCDNAM